jgi:transglutaminase-like putative cysteine protease
MVRLKLFIELRYEIIGEVSDFIFNIHAAQTRCQSLVSENLQISQPVTVVHFSDKVHGNRYARLRAMPGPLTVRYDAVVDLVHHVASPDSVFEVPIAGLPPEALAYIYPSRYCQSDRLHQFANQEFGGLRQGYWRVRAIQDWVHSRTRFVSGSSNAMTSAIDTLIEQVGVCRDFAHLMIALCRALNIPARFVTGIDYASDPIFGPPDFHAYLEVFLDDRWYMFDPTGMLMLSALIRIGTGRDAADVAFATIFGAVRFQSPRIGIEGIEDVAAGISLPLACVDALSTDDALA